MATAPRWTAVENHRFQEARGYMLNKSEWLEVTQAGTAEHPSVEVARVWFTGDRHVLTTINGMTVRGYELLGAGYAFVYGEQQGQAAAYTVQLSTGELTPGFHDDCRDIKPFKFPPVSKP